MRPSDGYITLVLFGLYETANIMNNQNRPRTVDEYEIARQTHYAMINFFIEAGAIKVK